MADNNQAQASQAQKAQDKPATPKAYFRSEAAPTLSVVTGPARPEEGEVSPQTERFTPYYEEAVGREGKFKVGYLATDNPVAIKKLRADFNVQEIDEETFSDATEAEYSKDGVQTSAFRAPF